VFCCFCFSCYIILDILFFYFVVVVVVVVDSVLMNRAERSKSMTLMYTIRWTYALTILIRIAHFLVVTSIVIHCGLLLLPYEPKIFIVIIFLLHFIFLHSSFFFFLFYFIFLLFFLYLCIFLLAILAWHTFHCS
jgi:hypothetical protein